MRWIVLCFLSMSGMMLLGGCGDDAPTANSRLKGSLAGYVFKHGNMPTSTKGLKGVTVTVDKYGLTSQTDEQGLWTISNVPRGIYAIRFSKEGYGFTKQSRIQFVGGGIFYTERTDLVAQPAYSVVSAWVEFGESPYYGGRSVRLRGKLSDTASRYDMILCYFSPEPLPDPLPDDSFLDTGISLDGGTRSFDGWTSTLKVLSRTFKPGQKVHVTLYVASMAARGYWVSESDRRQFSTGVNPKAKRLEFIMPWW